MYMGGLVHRADIMYMDAIVHAWEEVMCCGFLLYIHQYISVYLTWENFTDQLTVIIIDCDHQLVVSTKDTIWLYNINQFQPIID